MNGATEPRTPGVPRSRLSDAEWAEIEARHAAELQRHGREGSQFHISVEGDSRNYRMGEQIRVPPKQAGAAATVTGEDGQQLAVFFLPELDGGDVVLVQPGPLGLTLASRGGTATLHREVTTTELSLFDEANWLRCHWIVATLLAAAWAIIGAQVTLVEAVHGSFEAPNYAVAVNAYLLGTIPGALFFGWLADRVGRRPVYRVSTIIYIATAFATALTSPADSSLWAFRFLVGFAVGGDYVALNTTLQELMPKRRRGWACITINGTFWIGSLMVSLALLAWPEDNWVTAFLVVGALGLALLILRSFLPESPRWLIAHYRQGQNRWTQWMIEEIRRDQRRRPIGQTAVPHRVLVPAQIPGWLPVGLLWSEYRRQTLVCLALICAQAFFFDSFYFRYGLAVESIYSTGGAGPAPSYSPLIAGANLLGSVLLGWCFDRYGRRWAISATYMAAGLLLLGVAALIWFGRLPLDSLGMAAALAMVFFVASAAASSSYLTMGESFPVEIRASAFAILFGVGMATGVAGSVLYGVVHDQLVQAWFAETEDKAHIATLGIFCLASALAMLAAALVERRLGTEYAGRSLEELAPALSQVGPEGAEIQAPARA